MASVKFRRFAVFASTVLLFMVFVGAECGEQATATKIGEVTKAPAVTEAPTQPPQATPSDAETKAATQPAT